MYRLNNYMSQKEKELENIKIICLKLKILKGQITYVNKRRDPRENTLSCRAEMGL